MNLESFEANGAGRKTTTEKEESSCQEKYTGIANMSYQKYLKLNRDLKSELHSELLEVFQNKIQQFESE
jgi:hypothetical protein